MMSVCVTSPNSVHMATLRSAQIPESGTSYVSETQYEILDCSDKNRIILIRFICNMSHFNYMVKNTEPLPFYKEPLYYTGLIALIGIGLVIYSFSGNSVSSNLMVPSVLVTFIFGAATYFMWDTRCPHCKRPLSKKEKIEWREDLGIKKEPYTYHTKVYKYSDGTTEKVPESEKTIMRDKKYDRHYYICKKCEYGSDKEWKDEKGQWLGKAPKPQYIKKKGSLTEFGLNLFDDDPYENNKKRKNIPKAVKQDLWIRHFGKKYKGNCFVCNRVIETHNFEAGHIKSVANGGSDNISNLKPICMKCNRSMGTMNLHDYKKKYYKKK